jgi:hypothetical protein
MSSCTPRRASRQDLVGNTRFWALVAIVQSNPQARAEVRASICSLLDDDLGASSLILDVFVPQTTPEAPAQRRALLALLRLSSVARVLRSKIFYEIVFDRVFCEKVRER